jgi:CBS domain-containing protein
MLETHSGRGFSMGSTEEFIGLYHKLWDFLRHITDSDQSVSFHELVDKASELNGAVESEARSLKDYGRLGNAIKNHHGYPTEKIAEPTKDALSSFKYLVDNIISPKSLIPAFQAEVKCFSPNAQLVTALKYMGENDFSQIVIDDKEKVLLLTAEGVAKWLELQADKDVIRLSKVKLRDALACDLPNTFVVMGPDNTVYDAQEVFKKAIERKCPRLFAIIITANGKRTGKPIGIVTPWDLQPEDAPSSDYVFRRQQYFWNIVFEGKPILLKDGKGLRYIAYLLQSPGKSIHVSTLQAASEGQQLNPSSKIYGDMSGEQLEDYDLTISQGLGDAGTTLDPRAISQYKEHCQSLRDELQEAKAFNDLQRAATLQEQIDMISDQLKSDMGLGGKARKSADSKEKIRKAVTNRIKDSLKKIQKENRSLGLHLSKAIETGTFCSYSPEKSISWNF